MKLGSAGPHAPDHGLRADERAGQVGVERPPPLVEPVLEERRLMADAGVVDEEVQPAEFRFGSRDSLLDRFGIADVDAEPETAQLVRRVGRAFAVDVEHRDPRAFGDERAGQRPPDPARGAGDDPGASLQLPTHDRTSSRTASSTTYSSKSAERVMCQ